MLKIAVGTTSEFKNRAIAEVLAETKIEAQTFPYSVETGVKNQPREENETKVGSINRAKAVLKMNNEAECGLGIEVGYEPIDGKIFMHGWASIVDRDGNIYSEQSSTLELPKYFLQFLHDGDEIGYHVQGYKELNDDEQWKYFAEVIQYREPFMKESVRNVILRYYFRKEY